MAKNVIIVLISLIMYCGNGSEIGNAFVMGNLSDTSGNPAAGVTVQLIKTDFIPDRHNLQQAAITTSGNSSVTITDSNGNYSINAGTGTYNLIGESDSGSVFIPGIEVTSSEDVFVNRDTITQPGMISGMVLTDPDSITTVVVSVPGTIYFTTVNGDGSYLLKNIPEGNYTVIIGRGNGWAGSTIINDVKVTSGETTSVRNVTIGEHIKPSGVLEDFEFGNGVNDTSVGWYYTDDSKNEGTSVIVNALKVDNEYRFAAAKNEGFQNSYGAEIEYILGSTQPVASNGSPYNQQVFIGTNFRTPVDFSSKSMFKFKAKASENMEVRFEIKTDQVKDFGYYSALVKITNEWNEYSIKFEDLDQPGWAEKHSFDPTRSTGLDWMISLDNLVPASGSLILDDIAVE